MTQFVFFFFSVHQHSQPYYLITLELLYRLQTLQNGESMIVTVLTGPFTSFQLVKKETEGTYDMQMKSVSRHRKHFL